MSEQPPLDVALMQGTSAIHREAERVPFMVAFFKGELSRDAYAAYLGRLWYVYEALERSATLLKDDPQLGRFFTPELFRLNRLEQDVVAFAGDAWRDRIPPSRATQAYADRIHEVARLEPHRFVAHHWLRYLGYVLAQDILNRIVTKAYGDGASREFYAFPEIDDAKAYLRRYHEEMNALDLDDERRADVIDEGNRAFALQKALTAELAVDFGIGEASQEETDRLLGDLAAEHP